MSSTTAPQSFEIGERINDRFRVLSVLGAGGFGCVYKVADEDRGDQRVALKTIQLEQAGDLVTELFQREFAELTKFQHPNIATAYEYGRIGGSGQHFFTAEYIDGVDLMDGTKGKSQEEKLSIVAEMCRALEFVHNRGLIHHDLKPGNVLLAVPETSDAALSEVEGLGKLEMRFGDRARVVKLIDFGLIESEDLAADVVLGTPPYMSPERVQGLETDRRSDLYSVGVILYRLFTGAMPFDARGRQWFHAHVRLEPIHPEKRGVQLSSALTDVILRLLEKDPSDRYGSAAELVQALNAATGQSFSIDTRETSSQYLVSGPIVGRSHEISRMRECFDAISAGAEVPQRSIFVTGAPGYGVTRLLEDLRYHAQRSGAIVVRADARVGASLPEFIAQVARELRITGQDFEVDPTALETMPIAAVRVRIEEALLELAGHSPVVVLVDHVQTADEAVVGLCRDLVNSLEFDHPEEAPRIMLTLGDSGGDESELGGLANLQGLELRAFNAPTVGLLLEESFGVADVPVDFVRKLWSVSEGNPLYVVETVRHLAREGEIRRSGGKWILPRRPELIDLPESLTALASSKLLELPERVKSVLEWIAAYGVPIAIERLADLTSIGKDSLVGQVWAQVKSTLLTRVRRRTTRGESETLYRFSHEALREVLLDSIPNDRRIALHAAIAAAYEAEAEPAVESLAFHWAAAGDMSRFLEFGFPAAESLQKRGELSRAKEIYRDCLEALPPTDLRRRFQAMAKISELEEASGSPGAAAEEAQRLFAAAQRFLKPQDKNRLCRRVGLLHAKKGDVAAATSWLDKAEVGETELERLSIASVRLYVEEIVANRRSDDELWPECRHLLSKIDDPTDSAAARVLSSALDLIGKCAHRRSDHAFGIDAFERSRRLCLSAGSDQGAAATGANAGWLYFEIGEYDQAIALLSEAVVAARGLGDRPTLARALVGQAETVLARGKVELALELATEALRTARIGGDRTSISRALQALGSIQSFVGHGEAARGNMESALALEEEGSFDAAIAASRLARLYVTESAIDEARATLGRVREWSERLLSPRVDCLIALAESLLYLKTDEDERAEASLRDCVDLAQRYRFPRERAEVLLMRATHELCLGSVEAAKQSAVEASDTASRIEASDLQQTASRLIEKVDSMSGSHPPIDESSAEPAGD